jgi:pyruvate,water dikinase
MTNPTELTAWFETVGQGDVPLVGGKNASLGEMVRHLATRGVSVPPGSATTAEAYWRFVDGNGLREPIAAALQDLKDGAASLSEVGHAIRRAFLRGKWPHDVAEAVVSSYRELGRRMAKPQMEVAVRSSATAEDGPERIWRNPRFHRRGGPSRQT